MIIVSAFAVGMALLSSLDVIRVGLDRNAAMVPDGTVNLDGEFTPIPEPSSPVAEDESCPLLERIDEAKTMLSDVTLDVGDRDIAYSEVRHGTTRIYNDPEKEFALIVLHEQRCELELITITKRGDELIAPEGWEIEPVLRLSGIRWNNWNTEFKITKPANAVVVANVEPFIVAERPEQRLIKDGKVRTVYTTSRTIEYRPYVPYSRDLHTYSRVIQDDALVIAAREYLEDLVARVYATLRERGVRSRAFPERLVTELPFLTQEMFVRLPIIEHIDMLEFVIEPDRMVERVLVIIGGNKEDAFVFTCSHAGACGMMQFTDRNGNGTYSMILDRYPEAKLTLDFQEGAKDHLNAMMAAVLLHDNNLRMLVNVFGEDIAEDPHLEEYLAALYNASPASVVPAITLGRVNPKNDWAEFLQIEETAGYMVKLRHLQDSGVQYASFDRHEADFSPAP